MTMLASVDQMTPENVVAALYTIVSGTFTQPRDWARARKLMWPGARIRTIYSGIGQPLELTDLTVDQWFTRATKRFQASDFFERGVISNREIGNMLASIISPYESRREPDGEVFERGVNHYTLVLAETGWQVLQLIWEVEMSRPSA